MVNKLTDLRDKEVINLKDGYKMGYISDIEFDTVTGSIVSIIVYGKQKFFGLMGREEDLVIRWEDIEVIGDDTILVCCEPYLSPQKKKTTSVVKSIWN